MELKFNSPRISCLLTTYLTLTFQTVKLGVVKLLARDRLGIDLGKHWVFMESYKTSEHATHDLFTYDSENVTCNSLHEGVVKMASAQKHESFLNIC